MTHSGRRQRSQLDIVLWAMILWLVAVSCIRNVIHRVIRRLDVIRWDTTDISGRWSSCSPACGQLHPHRVLAGYTEHQHLSHATYVPRWPATDSNCLQALLRSPELRGGWTFLMGSRLWFLRMEFGGALCKLSEDAARLFRSIALHNTTSI